MNNLDQDRLVNFLIHKNGILHLDEGDYGPNLDIKKLVGKLKDSTDFELKGLVLNNVQYPDDLDEDLADALCKLPVISFEKRFRLKERLFQKLIFFPIATESILFYKKFHWSGLIAPGDLETLVDKMMAVELRGTFSPEQLGAVRSCPGVQVNSNSISKGFEFDFEVQFSSRPHNHGRRLYLSFRAPEALRRRRGGCHARPGAG